MRARWIERWGGPLQGGERPDPAPGPDEVELQVEACGVGMTVLNCMRGDLGADPDDLPRIPGHELVGRITAAGAGVDAGRIGTRVMGYFYLFCGDCPNCLADREPLCQRLGGYVGVNRDGGYAERVVLPARNAIPVPEGVDPVAATAVPDAIATPVHVARRAAIEPQERVAVIAAGGGVGAHMLQVARLRGAAVAGLEAPHKKLAFLEDELHVDAIDSTDFSAVSLPSGWSGQADVVIDLLGREESLTWATSALAPGGRLVLLTTFLGADWRVEPRHVVLGGCAILGSRYASRRDLVEAGDLIAGGRIQAIVTRQATADDVDLLHEALSRGELVGRGALTWQATAGDPDA
jgi:propanol-preferring alcohol dehydrogenase